MIMGLGLGLMIGQPAASGGGASYSAEATALFARFSTDPGSTRKTAIDTCITSLKSAGVWAKLDALWVFAAHDAQASLLNWVSSSHAMAATGSPTFTTDRGYTSDGSNYLATADTMSSYSLFTQNSAHFSIWESSTSPSSSNQAINIGAGNNIYPRYVDDGCYVRVNDSPESSAIATVVTPNGFTLGNRSSSTARQAYRGGVTLGTYPSTGSAAPENTNLTVFNQAGTHRASVVSIGGSLDSTEQLALYNALNTLKTAIGW